MFLYILPGQISASMTTFTRTLDEYSTTANQEIVPEKKQQAQTRIEGFRNELKETREEFNRLKQVRSESVYESNRAELIERRVHGGGTRHSGDDSILSENPYGGGSSSNGIGGSGSGSMYSNMSRTDGLARERDMLGRAGDQLDEFLERGKLVLENLGEQREMLKNTRRRIYSVANTLGISNETIRMVERRATQDKKIFYGGIFILIVCFYYILKWFG